MLTKKKNPTLAIDNLDRRLTEYETSIKQQSLESDYDKEIKFEKLRQQRARERETRPARYRWWFEYGDGRLADTWFRECLYFPKDNPTQEEREFYQYLHDEFVVNKRPFHLHLESTKEAFWQWYRDKLSLESDEEHFPLHQHGDHDFYHDQLDDQDYYYNPTIYGPHGESQNYLWDIAHDETPEHEENKKELEPYFENQRQRQRQQRKEKRPGHEF